MTSDPEKQSVSWRWVVGVLVGVIILLVGSWAAQMQTGVNQLISKQTALETRQGLLEQRFNLFQELVSGRLSEIIENQREMARSLTKHRENEGESTLRRPRP